MKYGVALLTLMLLIAPAHAQQMPVPGTGDPRLQTILYDPDQVVQLEVAAGYQLMISFAPGEHIETMAVGDSTAWQVSANKRGDYLFIKSVQAGENSNLTVVSDMRVYNFELIRAFSAHGAQPFMVRFLYPEPVGAQVQPVEPATGDRRYRIGGAKAIRPSMIAIEEGRAVITWPDKTALPAIFRVDGDGTEMLVNGEMQDGRFVIEDVPEKLIFRLDRLKAGATLTRSSRPRK